MNRQLRAAAAALCVGMLGVAGAQAADTWPIEPDKVRVTQPQPTDILVYFGMTMPSGRMAIQPSQIRVATGKLYRLILENPGTVTHYVTAPEFDAAIATRAVEVTNGEVRGSFALTSARYFNRIKPVSMRSVREIELRPGGRAEWVFTAHRAGRYRFECAMPAHIEAGMTAQIVVG